MFFEKSELPRTIVIDANNVVMGRPCMKRWNGKGPKPKPPADSRILAALLLWVRRHNAGRDPLNSTKAVVVADANLWPITNESKDELGDVSADILERIEAGSGLDWQLTRSETNTRADGVILGKVDNARRRGESVWLVSNDKFKPKPHKDADEKEYEELYPWLKDAKIRRDVLHGFLVDGQELEIFGTGERVSIPQTVEEYGAGLAQCEELRKQRLESEGTRKVSTEAPCGSWVPSPVTTESPEARQSMYANVPDGDGQIWKGVACVGVGLAVGFLIGYEARNCGLI